MTGASGGIGQHLKLHLLETGAASRVIPVSGHSLDGSSIALCNLIQQVSDFKDIAKDNTESVKVDWIVHLATSSRVGDDLRMLRKLLECARENNIPNFLYVSSWVVHFPKACFREEYIEMKRQCEQLLIEQKELPECIKTVQIVRPSVVTGKGLSWSRVLTRLSLISPLIPRAFTRSFLPVEELNQAIASIIAEEKEFIAETDHSRVSAVTLLGQRTSLSEKSAENARSDLPPIVWGVIRPLLWLVALFIFIWPQSTLGVSREFVCLLLVAIYLIAWFLQKPFPFIISKVSDYLAGFVCIRFEPETETDVLALIDHHNSNVKIRGYDNARLYFHNPNSPGHTTVSLKKFNQILSVDAQRMTVRVQAGVHFAQLLTCLEQQGFWLDNYPNYHFISVGACILTPVHGSSLTHSFIADLVTWIRYYDRGIGKIIAASREDSRFADVIFNTEKLGEIVILEVELRICRRIYYRLTSEVRLLEELSFDNIQDFIMQEQHCEVRINTPNSKNAYFQSYEEVPAETSREGLLAIKADRIGSIWNTMQKNQFNSWLSSKITQWTTINYEWFFQPQDFTRFWAEISSDNQTYRMYKLLLRYNCKREDVNTPYHGTISIDVEIPNSRAMIECSKRLFKKYSPLEHQGKYSIEKNYFN